MSATTETRKFEAEVAQVLHLVTHSLYSNKDVFLRELVSNASDACDKLRFQALADPETYGSASELRITLTWDKDARTITLRDTGIGMSREELIDNLGTVARSGTRRFLEALSESQKADAAMIGQFGVGFYSAFVVADRVTVSTRRAGEDDAWQWTSDGAGEYTLQPADDFEGHGTAVTVHLKDGEDEYLDPWKLRSLVHKYSDHIGFPILMPKQQGEEDKGEPELEPVNQASALWARPRNELSDEDYQAFYRHVAHDFGEALAWTHNRVEGNQNFTSLLYVPAHAPFDFMAGREERKGLKLYIKRVFIMDAAEQMLPSYLRFVRGVVDSDDLPLNVSREILQNNRQVERIKGALTKRSLDLLDRLASEDATPRDNAAEGTDAAQDADNKPAQDAGAGKDKYATFWSQFGNVLKEGVVEDTGNREKVAKLLRFPSTRSERPDQLVSFDDYLARARGGQEAIYYLTADGWNAARNSPQLEALKAAGIEVLLMHERIDEWMVGYLTEYQGKPLRNVAKGELPNEVLDAVGKETEQAAADAEPLVQRLKTLLGERVSDVRVSRRLTESASCLVLDEHDMALHMQRLLRAAGQDLPSSKPVLEVNPAHPLLARLQAEADDARAGELALVVLEQAQLAEGVPLDDPSGFLRRVNALLTG